MRLATFKDDETGEVIPKMAEKIKELSGVDITNINGQLKNTYEIYTEIGKIYKDLDKNTRMQLNEILGGKLRGNVVAAILSNVSELERAYDLANNSAGSAMKEFETYQEGIEYSVDRLKEQINGLYASFVSSDFLKGLTEGAVYAIGTIHKIVDTFGAFPSVITAAVGGMTLFNSKFREQVNLITTSIVPINNLQNKITNIGKFFDGLGEKYKTQIELMHTFKDSAKTSGNVIDGFGLQLLGLNGKLTLVKAATVATQISIVALQAAMSMGLSLAISGCISLITKWIGSIETAEKKAQKLSEASQNMATAMSEYSDNSKLLSDYAKIKKQIDDISTAEEERNELNQELSSVKSQLANVDSQAYAILNNQNIPLERQLELLKHINDEKMREKALELENSMGKQSEANAMAKDVQIYANTIRNLQDALSKGDGQGIAKILGVGKDFDDAKQAIDDYKAKIENLRADIDVWNSNVKMLKENNLGAELSYVELGDGIDDILDTILEASDNIDKLGETTEETAEALRDINGDGIIDATDEMLHLAMITNKAKTAVENLANSFSGLQGGIELLQQMKEEYSEYGMIDTNTMSKVLSSGDSQLITLLADEANFIENINSLLDQKTKAQDEVLKTTIAMAQAEVNGSQAVVDGINAEVSALGNLNNAVANSAQYRANQESILASQNAENYMIDEVNHNNKENNKLRSSFDIANKRISNEKDVVDGSATNYSIDDKNHVSLINSKIEANDTYTNLATANAKATTDQLNENYKIDAKNYANYINSIISNIRARAKAESALTGGTLGFKNESEQVMAKYQEYLKLLKEAENASNAVNNYVGSGGISSNVGHGSLGSGSGGSGGSSGNKPSKDKEIADIEETTDWYIALNNAIADNNRLLEENRNAQKHANGTQKIALMKKEIELLEKQAHAKKQLAEAYWVEAIQSKDYLRSQGFEIDSMDNLVNASIKILQLKQQANKLSGSEKEAAIKRIELIEKQIDRFTELTNNLVPGLRGEHEELNNSIKDLYKDQLDLVANTEKEIYEVIEHYEGKKKDAKLKAIEEQRKALEELYELEDRNDDLEKKQSNLADIKNQMDLYENAQDSAGKAKYEELKKQYDDLLKEFNTTIRDNQKDSILDSLEAQKENVEKEYEEFFKPENINKIISDAMKDGYIKLGDEVLDLNNATTQYLAETTKGTQSLINANHELLNSYLSIMEIAKDLPKLNANVGNIGINMNAVHSSIPRNNIGKSVNFENITVQITGGTNMNQADITKAVQKAFIDISNNYKF